MKKIKNEQLKKIKGGGINWSLVAGISAITSFVVGIIDGLIHPKRCNS